MAHSRETIRKAIVTRLTGLATTGANVESWRTHALGEDEIPHLSILPGEDPETISEEIENHFGTIEVRDLPVIVRARTIGDTGDHTGLADAVSDITAEVEVAMMTDPTFGGLAVDSRLISTLLSIDGSGERPVGMAEMTWIVRYSVDRSNPTG